MTKIALIYPSRTKETNSEELLYSPLALAYLGRHTPGHFQIASYDEYVGEDVDPGKVDADIVAMSAITPGISRSYELADQFRKRGIYCVGGGAHLTALPAEGLCHFDTVIRGEGEQPWREFLADFDQGSPKPDYFGAMNVSLDGLGTPRRDLIHKNYEYPSVLTSRGCPYNCSFCYLTVYRPRKYRLIPNDTIIEDLDTLRGNRIVVITDENFMGYSQKDIEQRKILLERMIQKNYGFYWGCQSVINLADEPELMELMHRAGCRAVFIGFESVSEEGLKEVNKRQNCGVNYKEAIKKIHDHKIGVIASCIFGMDSHGKDYPRQLIRSLKEAKADFPRLFFMTAWPGTPLFDKLEKEGRANRDWDQVRKDMPSIQFKNFSHQEAMAARKEILDACFSPFRIVWTVMRWIFKDRSIIVTFVRMCLRNRVFEYVKRFRVHRFWRRQLQALAASK